MQRHFYLDASALAKRYVPEIGTSIIDHLFLRLTPDRIFVLNIGTAEVVSIIVRKRNAGILSHKTSSQAFVDLQTEIINEPGILKVDADTDLVTGALPLIIRYSINATDAVLLRSAIDAAANLRSRGGDLVLVASDQRLLRAAQTEGLAIFNPETQTAADLDSLFV